MAEEKTSAKKESGPPSGLWFTKTFQEGSEAEPKKSKKRAIERYYEGFLRGYNAAHTSDFRITKFDWNIESEGPPTVHRLDVYIAPPPIVTLTTTDPPTPIHPPPRMTFDVGTDADEKDILSNA